MKTFSWICTMAFGKSFATFNYSFLPWHKCKSSLLTLPSPLDHDLHQIQQVEPPHVIISIQISFKYFLPSNSTSWRFTKELHFLFGLLPPNSFPLLVLWTLNLEPWRSTGLQFKNFKLHQLQVWTRFAKFGEIHSKPSPKIPDKFMQPLGALSDHLTKLQLQKNLSLYQNLLSNTCIAWSLSSFS